MASNVPDDAPSQVELQGGLTIDQVVADFSLASEHSGRTSNSLAKVIRGHLAHQAKRISGAEFGGDLSPDQASRQLTHVADVLVQASLRFAVDQLADQRGLPLRSDGTHPKVTVIGLQSHGGEEMSYNSPLRLIFLFDAIDPRNVWHRDFYETLVCNTVAILEGDPRQADSFDVDLRCGPKFEVGVSICSLREAARIFETSGRVSQRMEFIKARVVAGSETLGTAFLDRLKPWIYQQFNGSAELAEMEAIQHRLHRRAEQSVSMVQDFVTDPGGMDDVDQIVACLQLLHGGHLAPVRQSNINDAIVSLQREKCLSNDEASGLLQRYARLTRLKHQLAVSFDNNGGKLPTDHEEKQKLAWELGIKTDDESEGDVQRFETLLAETLADNRAMMAQLMQDDRIDPSEPADETELLLDANPDPIALQNMMKRYAMEDTEEAIQQLAALSVETVPFLSHQLCRHAFASLAPDLLSEIAQTPDPDQTSANVG